MLYSYEQCLKKYKTDYRMKKQISAGKLFKIETGIYSDEQYVPEIAIISFKYPYGIISMNSAFYYHGLTDTIPAKYYLTTDKNSSKIKDKRVKQNFENSDYLELGQENVVVDGASVKMYSKERMLVELVRSKPKFPFDYYKELISSYRKIINNMNIQAVQEYAYLLPKTNMVIETLELEVF